MSQVNYLPTQKLKHLVESREATDSGARDMIEQWLESLTQFVEKKPLAVLRFSSDEWEKLSESRRGLSEFTFTRSHELLAGISPPTACLIFSKDEEPNEALFGLISSRSAVTTLDTRAKVKRAMWVQPASETELVDLVNERRHRTTLRERLQCGDSVVQLSAKLSAHLVENLAKIGDNLVALRAVAASLIAPKHFRSNESLQDDAIRAVLKAFGLSADHAAVSVEFVEGKDTALTRINIVEDGVIEHDARHVPGYELV